MNELRLDHSLLEVKKESLQQMGEIILFFHVTQFPDSYLVVHKDGGLKWRVDKKKSE